MAHVEDDRHNMEGTWVSESLLSGEAPAAPAKWHCALCGEDMHLFETLLFLLQLRFFLQNPISLFTK